MITDMQYKVLKRLMENGDIQNPAFTPSSLIWYKDMEIKNLISAKPSLFESDTPHWISLGICAFSEVEIYEKATKENKKTRIRANISLIISGIAIFISLVNLILKVLG